MIFFELFSTFFIIGMFTIGGGYAMLSLIQNEVVTVHGWIDETTFTIDGTIDLDEVNELVGIELPEEVLDFLAENLRSNIRQIEGAIKKIHVISNLASVPITLDLCRRAIADIINGVELTGRNIEVLLQIFCFQHC